MAIQAHMSDAKIQLVALEYEDADRVEVLYGEQWRAPTSALSTHAPNGDSVRRFEFGDGQFIEV